MTVLSSLLVASMMSQELQGSSPAPFQAAGAVRVASAAPAQEVELPVSLERIQRALARPSALRMKSDRPVFRVEVLGRKPTIMDFLGPDYLKGPAPYGGMTHAEFLNMVTPKDVQGYAAFSNGEAFTVAATSFALQWALQKAVLKFENAKKEREREAARAEVQDALAALAKARQRAGLPPK